MTPRIPELARELRHALAAADFAATRARQCVGDLERAAAHGDGNAAGRLETIAAVEGALRTICRQLDGLRGVVAVEHSHAEG